MAAAASSAFESSMQEKSNGTKLARLLIDLGTHVLRKFLHSVYPPAKLQRILKKNRPELKGLKSRRVIYPDQFDKLFPPSGDPPDAETFDITLLHLLLRELCHLKAPPTGWNRMPVDSDTSPEANIIRIKCFRNELCHSVSTGIPHSEFEGKWNKISSSLQALDPSIYERIQDLKNDSIDEYTQREVDEQVEKWKGVQELDESEPTSLNLFSRLPDKIPEERMFGRTKEIKQVVDFVQSGTIPVVLVTGGPGFGKTAVAKEVAHDLAKPENSRTVLFCSLLTKKNLNDVATEMIHSSGTIQTQLPENPENWLKDWSKQIQTQITFVLDNADGVLDSNDRNSFLRVLCAVRILSKRNVTFIITTRKTFSDPELEPKELRLTPLSSEEAKNVLLSRVNDQDDRQKLSKTGRIVELCGAVPLALCIVGSLLSDYTEENLIKHLEEEPLTVLEDDDTSVENAIKTSFDLLSQKEQDAFVLMSVFPGPFNSDAAEAVMKACSPEILPVSVLRSLKNRSLVEQPSSHSYQMHPLIHAFAKKFGRTKCPQRLAEGEKLACAHFISRLANSANMFWSKDQCKDSVEAFNEDRHNFEHFLQIYVQGRKNQDREVVDGGQTFLEGFPPKCMYLEKCVLPKFYVFILESLLDTFDPETQPVRRVDLLCLLGHESRKGNNEKYHKLMEEASKIYSKNIAKFESEPVSEVYFRNSYVRFLSDKKDPNQSNPIKQETALVLQVSGEKLGDHPEAAATLLFAGRTLAKRRQEREQSEQMLKKALELFKKCLGKHFMTAECLKAIADLNFFFAKTDADLDVCLEGYEAAMKIFYDLGMGESKESILTLKNFGECHRERNNFDEAMELLTKAGHISEQEIDGDHIWKVWIKTELALLHDKMGNPDQAKAEMLEGLRMGNRRNLPICKMGSKDYIRKFINRYPETFPEGEFPGKPRKPGPKEVSKT